MARIRSIKPQFFLNEEISELPSMVRLLFIGLWTQADREGRLLDRPKRLKAEIFPYDNFDIDKGLNQLFDAGFIFRYKVNANVSDSILAPEQPINELALIQIINFLKHQKIDKVNEKESDLPPPGQLDYKKTTTSLPIDGEGKGKERKGKEGKPPPPITKNFIPDKSLHGVDLDETDVDLTITYIETVCKKPIDKAEVERMWKGFKIQNFNGVKAYVDWSDVNQHFRNWLQIKMKNSVTQDKVDAKKSALISDFYEARNSQLK